MQVKRRHGRKYYPPSEFVPADVGPDGKVQPMGPKRSFKVVPHEQTEEEDEKEDEERKVSGMNSGRFHLLFVKNVWAKLVTRKIIVGQQYGVVEFYFVIKCTCFSLRA